MKKLWNKWCKRVEYHNRYIDYGNYEDAWSPSDIFGPLVFSIFVTLIVWAITLITFSEMILVYLFSVFMYGIFYYSNWSLTERENRKIDASKVNKPYCDECKYSFQQFEYCQELPDGRIVCEKCFFDIAMDKIGSKEKKIDFQYNIVPVDCEDTRGYYDSE